MPADCRPKRPARADKARQRSEERRRRLAAALRDNLRRRKEQARARREAPRPAADEAAGEPEPGD